MDIIKTITGDLNRVYLYFNLEEDEIDNSLYYSYDDHIKRDFGLLLSTKCGTTSRLICYLLGMKYNGKFKKFSTTSIDTSNSVSLTKSCVIEISSNNFKLPSHVITFFNGKIYHSYAMKYTLREKEMNKEDLEKTLDNFLKTPNKKTWQNITEIDDFEVGEYDIIVYEYIYSEGDIIKRAKFLIDESIQALDGKRDDRHIYDDFLLVLPQNPKKFLKDLKIKLLNQIKMKLDYLKYEKKLV